MVEEINIMFKSDDEYNGYILDSEVLCKKDKNDFWRVSYKIIQKRSIDGGETWEEKSIASSATNENLDRAYASAFLTLSIYLEKVCGNLFLEDEIEAEEVKFGSELVM